MCESLDSMYVSVYHVWTWYLLRSKTALTALDSLEPDFLMDVKKHAYAGDWTLALYNTDQCF